MYINIQSWAVLHWKDLHKAVLSSPLLGRILLEIASLSPHSCLCDEGKREILCESMWAHSDDSAEVTGDNLFCCSSKESCIYSKVTEQVILPQVISCCDATKCIILRPNFIVFISTSHFFILWIFWHVNIFFSLSLDLRF